MSGAYKVEHRATKKAYVGSAADVNRRVSNHRYRLALGQHTNPALQELYKGLDGAAFHEHFEVTKIPTDTRDEAYVVEQTLIDQLKETGLLLARRAKELASVRRGRGNSPSRLPVERSPKSTRLD